jgi:peptide/nickel transport system substrate-binding protein
MNNNRLFSPRRVLMTALVAILALFIWRYCASPSTPTTEQLSVRLDAAPKTMTPLFANVGPSAQISAQTFQTLGTLDPQTLELIPFLAKNIPAARNVSEGPYAGMIAYDFEIMPEATWDNGAPVTAADVVFTFKIIFHPKFPTGYLSFLEYLKGLEADPTNPKKFTAYFSQYYILALETMCQTPIYPAYNYDPAGRLANVTMADLLDTAKVRALAADPNVLAFADEFSAPKFVKDPSAISGSGPYRLESMGDQGAVLLKKENWWGDKIADRFPQLAAYPKRLVYKVVVDENIVENMLHSGELDLVGASLSPGKFLEMKQNDSLAARYDFHALPSAQYSRWILNGRRDKLKDRTVRQALAHVADYSYLLGTVQQGLAKRTVGPVGPDKPYYAKDLAPYEFNVQKARELLASAGWQDSNGDGIVDKIINGTRENLSIDILVPTASRTNELAANNLQTTARQAGVQLNILATDLNEISRLTRAGQYDAAFLGGMIFPGLVELKQLYYSSTNRSGIVNPALDSLIDAIRVQPDEAKRNALYVQAQKRLHDDVFEVFLYAPLQRVIAAKKFDQVLSNNRPGYYEQLFRLK